MRETRFEMSFPYRALLPVPMPDNVIPIQVALDRLILHVGSAGGSVVVESEATGAAATLREAVRDRRLGLGEGEARFDVPVTRTEASILSGFLGPAQDWELASASGDRYAMAACASDLQAIPTPWWLDLRIALPRRASVARAG